MKEVNRTIIPVKAGHEVRALCWHGDELIDWAGIIRYQLDGTSSGPTVNYAYRFDQAVSSPSGKYVVLHEQLGTKGLILKSGKVVREINRSFYCAHVYEYPVSLLTLPDGRDVIAHCPDHYNVIEIEEVESGTRLTSRTGEAADFFHSRLQVSSDSRYLLSAGWAWHPWNTIQLYDIAQALQSPESLDQNWKGDLSTANVGEIHTAAFNGPDVIVFAGVAEEGEITTQLQHSGERSSDFLCLGFSSRDIDAPWRRGSQFLRKPETSGACYRQGVTSLARVINWPAKQQHRL